MNMKCDAHAPGGETTHSGTELRAVMALEAMRLGVVPLGELEKNTVGRSEEIALIHEDLKCCAHFGSARRAFLGEYGCGKSHLLELVRQIALQNNFLVSGVTLDHGEMSPAHPKRVYHSVVKHVVYPDGTGEFEGLRPLLLKAAQNEKALDDFLVHSGKSLSPTDLVAKGGHLYLTAALQVLNRLAAPSKLRFLHEPDQDKMLWIDRMTHDIVDWIEGHPTQSNQELNQEAARISGRKHRLYSLLDFRPWAKIYGYMLSGISTLAKCVGYNGLVIVIDEAEFYMLLSSQNRHYARSLFQAWSHAAAPDDDVPFTEDELITGGYGIQRQLPGKYSERSGLCLIFAMTPNTEGIRVLHEALPAHLICNLNPFSQHDYLQITRNVCRFFAQAYPDNVLPDGIEEPLAEIVTGFIEQGRFSNPRQAMKFLTEFLDILRYSPQQLPKVIESLKMQDDF